MAITGATIVQDTLIELGVIDASGTVSTNDSDYCLRKLNRLVDGWATQNLMIYGLNETSFTMTAGTATYSTGVSFTTRPTSINSIFVRLSNIDYPVDVVDVQTYDDIAYKLTQAIPNQCYIRWSFPDALLTFYPVPNAAYTCFVEWVGPLTSGAIASGTSLSLPLGYERALVQTLVVECAPAYGVQLSAASVQSAVDSVANLKRLNYEPLRMNTDFDREYDPSGFIYKGF